MKYAALILVVTVFFSCHNYKKDTERLQTKVDSLKTLTVQKDSTIKAFFSDFSEIQANLDSIKKMETLLDVSGSEPVLKTNQKEKILADISTLNGLLKDNNEMIASLKHRLHNSTLKSGKLESMVNELEQRSKNLQESLNEKDMQIADLNETVQKQYESIGKLNDQIAEIEVKSSLQLDTMRKQKEMLNKAFYTVGSVHELKDEGIVEREGGILGIGSVPVMTNTFTQDYFTRVDKSNFEYLPLQSRKAEVVSVHPIDSYHLSGNESRDTLYVDKPDKFWSASNYLVIATK